MFYPKHQSRVSSFPSILDKSDLGINRRVFIKNTLLLSASAVVPGSLISYGFSAGHFPWVPFVSSFKAGNDTGKPVLKLDTFVF